MQNPDNIVKINVPRLSRTSEGIREHIFYHLQVEWADCDDQGQQQGKLLSVYFSEEMKTEPSIEGFEETISARKEPESTVESELLYLDIVRNDKTYRVQVFKRKSKRVPYTLKVWNVEAEDTVVKTSVPSLSRTSAGIRQHIWDNLQVEQSPDGNHLIGVYFT